MTLQYSWFYFLISSIIPRLLNSQSPFIDPLITTTLQSSPTADILCILKTSNHDLKKHTDHFSTKNEKGEYVFNTLRAEAEKTQKEIKKYLSRNGYEYKAFYIVNGIHVVKADRDLMEYLGRRDEVERIEFNSSYSLDNDGVSPMMNTNKLELREAASWGIKKIKADSLWARGYKGKGVVIGSMDSGVNPENFHLKYGYRGYRRINFFAESDHNYNWHDATHAINPRNNDPSLDPKYSPCGLNRKSPCDDNDHGTTTLSVAAAGEVTNSVHGVAPSVNWIACKCFDRVFTQLSGILECFEWFLAPTDSNGIRPLPYKSPDIIITSWGCEGTGSNCNPENYVTLEKSLMSLIAAGIFIASSAGNKGSSGCGNLDTPLAIFKPAFTVGSVNINDRISFFSSSGPVTIDRSNRLKPDIVAPGEDIPAFSKSGFSITTLGTSYAAPHVAGAVALLISAFPELSGQVELIQDILRQSARPLTYTSLLCGTDKIGISPNNKYGHGLLDVNKAYYLAKAHVEAKTGKSIENNFSIFPNPARHSIWIRANKDEEYYSLQLLSVTGILVQETKELREKNYKMDLNQKPGIYFLRINTYDELTYIKKIIIQ